jgi:hypothetical protein
MVFVCGLVTYWEPHGLWCLWFSHVLGATWFVVFVCGLVTYWEPHGFLEILNSCRLLTIGTRIKINYLSLAR